MPSALWTQRFFESTQGRIVELLRKGARTVDELAAELGLTANAVRSHLAALERDGVVRASGVRRVSGAGKPATLYELQLEIEPLLSRAYAPALAAVLEEVAARLSLDELRLVLREAGRRMAAAAPAARGGGRRTPGRVAVEILGALGGSAVLEEPDASASVIRAHGCPLGVAVRARPELCLAVESFLAELTGADVRSCCTHGSRPHCCFEIRERQGVTSHE